MRTKLSRHNIHYLGDQVIDQIKDLASSKVYDVQMDLFYEGHIPVVAYLILDGKVQLTKNRKIKGILDSGHLIGLSELMNHVPSKVGARILPNTEVCFIDRSTVLEIFDDEQLQELSTVLRDIVEID